MYDLIDHLRDTHQIDEQDLVALLTHMKADHRDYLIQTAHDVRMKHYGNRVFMRGLIEFSNICERACHYCGIRMPNLLVPRYRLDFQTLMACCEQGYELGYRTFVLQSGEVTHQDETEMVTWIQAIKNRFPDCALTLSLGEKSADVYEAYFAAGADRYLLRFETAHTDLYQRLHPGMSLANRIECLKILKAIGYQMGSGFLVGLPGQSLVDHAKDLLLLKQLQPDMVGIGPFMPHGQTPLKDATSGTLKDTVTLIALTRLLLPAALIPATTALGSIDPLGREAGIKAGANVVMPNLTPTHLRGHYTLYDGKICLGDEAAECRVCIEGRIRSIGFEVDMGRGDALKYTLES